MAGCAEGVKSNLQVRQVYQLVLTRPLFLQNMHICKTRADFVIR